ncbi:unnamed protein product [Acanthoscelides obtectus]|uniref:Uncharacterized protein n=1 Tax=Acanthoscelides obtectus TaxID=200917 RepID=A0A9P0LA64_ACAOB|nr:unnamed protein product [Acanthoscelides obtectus]CAK1651696.1 hypothetical protein AOBTE_LOCUS17396 [Acanthoscelides obtectus]
MANVTPSMASVQLSMATVTPSMASFALDDEWSSSIANGVDGNRSPGLTEEVTSCRVSLESTTCSPPAFTKSTEETSLGLGGFFTTSLKNIAKLFFTERKNWRCKGCTIKCKSTPNTPATDVIVLRHEVECLNREKELLLNLNSELKCNNELLKEKLSSYAAKTRGPFLNQANTGTVSCSTAKKSQNKHILSSAGIIVKSNNNSISNTDVLNDIKNNINPKDLQLCLSGIKKIRNGVVICCDDDKSLGKLKEHVSNKLGRKYEVSNTKLYNPRIMVKNIQIPENSSVADIIDNISSINDLQDLENREIKFVTKLNYPNATHLVLEVSPEVLATLRFYACGSHQEITGSNHFVGISQASMSRAIKEVTEALNQPQILATKICDPDLKIMNVN